VVESPSLIALQNLHIVLYLMLEAAQRQPIRYHLLDEFVDLLAE
jgi:hypothetical protein